MINSASKWYSIISGTIFLLLLLIIVIFIPCPTTVQANFFRIFLSIASGSFAATLPGTFHLKYKWLSATGSLGVFALIYLVNPAGWNNEGCSLRNLNATVYLNGKLTQGVSVIFADVGRRYTTDEFGMVSIPYSTVEVKFPTKLIFKYKSEIDTTVLLNSLPQKLDFNLVSKKIGRIAVKYNALSYTINDITVNLSVFTDSIPKDEDTDDTKETEREKLIKYIIPNDNLTYHFARKGDTILIFPESQLLRLINEHEPIRDFDIYYFNLNLPKFDIKFTNNSTDAIFLNQIILDVQNSTPKNDVIFIPWASENIGLHNIGWGTAKNVNVSFNTSATSPDWNKPFESFVRLKDIEKNDNADFTEEAYKNLIKKGVAKSFLTDSEHYASKNPVSNPMAVTNSGDFSQGAFVFGTITFDDEKQLKKTQKFETYLAFGLWPGGAVEDFSWKYNAILKADSRNYVVSIPMSNSIKPKDFDRISLAFSATQSSSHCFYLSFAYNDRVFKIPYPFKMEYFMRSDLNEYLKKK